MWDVEGLVLNTLLLTAAKMSTRRSALGCHVDLESGTIAACSLSHPRRFLSGGTVRHHRGRQLTVSSASLPIYQGCISTVHGGNIGVIAVKG